MSENIVDGGKFHAFKIVRHEKSPCTFGCIHGNIITFDIGIGGIEGLFDFIEPAVRDE